MADHPSNPLSAYITVSDASAAIDFYVGVFGAEELYRLIDPADGRIGHAELKLGDSLLMISDEYPDFGAMGPDSLGGSPVKLHLYVADADAVYAAAVERGATGLRPVKEQFFGDRSGQVSDPWGHVWFIATKAPTAVSPEEMQRRWNAMMEG